MNNQEFESNLYRTLARNLPDMAVFMFDLSMRYLIAEGTALDVLGVSSKQLEGKTIYDVTPPEILELLTHHYTQALNGIEHQFDLEFNRRIYQAKVTPVRNSSCEVIGGMSVVQDITERAKIEKSQRLIQKRYQALFEQINDAVFIVSLDGRYLEINHKGAEMLGYKSDELVGEEISKVVDPAELDQTYGLLEAFKMGYQLPVYERTMMKKDGTKIKTEVNITPVRDETGNLLYIQAVVRDITQRKEAETALRVSEERYRIISELISDFAYSVSLDADGTMDYEWMTYGPVARLLGYSMDELRKNSVMEIYHPDDHERLFADRAKLLKGEPVTGEYRVFTKSGSQIWLHVYRRPVWDDAEGRVIRFYAVAQDITDRKLTEAALRKSEERFRLVAQVTSDALYDLDLKSKTIWRNEGYQRLFGFPYLISQELDWWTKGIHPDDRDAVLESGYKALSGNAQTWTHEYRFKNFEGAYINILDRRYIMRDFSGNAIRVIGAISDITQRKQAERQALELNLEREKVRLLSEFIAAVSHDFRTPLSVINTCIHLLRKSPDPEYQSHQFEMLTQQVVHIEKLVDGIVTMSRLDHETEMNMKPTDLNDLITYADVHKQKIYKAKHLSVTLKLDRSLPLVRVNQDWIYRCFINLLENAIFYTPDEGAITIQTCRQNDEFIYEIIDTGIGISQEDQRYIFDPLYRAEKHRPTGGQGLGLTIVKRVIEKHGGHIEVESVLNQGSSFRICLPIRTER